MESPPIRSVLITGASSGIGAAAAGHLHARGFRVFGASRRPPEEGPAPGWKWLPMDVTDPDAVRAGVDQVVREAGRLDALVCNAGFGLFGSVEEVPLEAARRQLEVNYFGALNPIRAVLPGMRAAGRGRLLLVGSLAGRAPIPFQAHYSASKAALEALALALYNEVRPFGIHVTLIEPGDIDTPFNDHMHWHGAREDSPYAPAASRCEARIREILPRAPDPGCVARAVERALRARRPRVRYTMGAGARLAPVLRRALPDRLVLAALRAHFRL